MIFLALDLATTGLFKDDQPPPHIVGLAAAVFDDEKVLSEINLLVRPEGFEITDDVEKIHGIGQKMAARYGVPLRAALPMLTNMADTVSTIVSYGFESYDAKVVRAALARFGSQKPFPRTGAEGVCVRETATQVCGVPSDTGLRWPSLQTAHLNVIGRPHTDASPTGQMHAAARLYRAFKQKGL